MSYEGTLKCIPGPVAGEDLSALQYRCMVQVGGVWMRATSAGSSCWVLQNEPTLGQEASIAYAGVSKAVVGRGGVSVGFVMCDSLGKVTTAAAGCMSLGLALADGNENEVIPVLLFGAWLPDET